MRTRRLIAQHILAAGLVLTLAGSLRGQEQQVIGGFTFMPSKDPISDDDRSGLFTTSKDGRLFGFRCQSDGLNVTYIWNSYFIGDNDSISVVYRLTPNPAGPSSRWTMATNNRGGFMPMHMVSAFTKQALTSQTLVLRVVDRDGDQFTDEFKLDGLIEGIKRLPCYKPSDARPTPGSAFAY